MQCKFEKNPKMNRPNNLGKNNQVRMVYVARHPPQNQIRPLVNDESNDTPRNTDPVKLHYFRSISPKNVSIDNLMMTSMKNQNNGNRMNVDISSRSVSSKTTPTSVSNVNSSTRKTGNFAQRFLNWFTMLTVQGKVIFLLIVVGITISTLTLTIVPPVYVYAIRQSNTQSSFTNITATTCSSSTCIGQETPYHSSIITALYPFDGNFNDLTGTYTGTLYGTTTPWFSTGGYVNQALVFSGGIQQYVQIPNIDLSKKSFTIQVWLYTSILSGTNSFGIFGQCDSNLMCLSLSLQGGRFSFTFDSLNSSSKPLLGSSFITSNIWVHATFVYDATLYQQSIYVDGQLDSRSYGIVSPYQGVSSSSITTIGRSSSNVSGTTYYYGAIDHFTISAGIARNACQIYNDATLVAYYPFDTSATYNDYSVYFCNCVASGTTVTSSSQFNQAISFTTSASYVQAPCFGVFRGYYTDYAFSFSLWINPTSVAGGTLIHLSSNIYGNVSCYDPLVFTSNGTLVCQWRSATPNTYNIQGPVISTNMWTHIAAVYSNRNGLRLYVNGQLSATSSYGVYINLDYPSYPWYLVLGNKGPLGSATLLNCLNGSIPIASGPFSGIIDEFRLYNRELSKQEICILANQ